jgi:hypothetical protein
LQRKRATLIGHRGKKAFNQYVHGIVDALDFTNVEHLFRVALIILVEDCALVHSIGWLIQQLTIGLILKSGRFVVMIFWRAASENVERRAITIKTVVEFIVQSNLSDYCSQAKKIYSFLLCNGF